MKSKLLLIASFLLLCGQTFAQRFEWAKGFAAGENVAIVGSVVDSVGNLYILASINFNTCWENGSRLLPIAPYGNAQDDGDVLIAKISPAGELVWRKVIHGEATNSIPHDIKLVGDSAFACLVTMPLASEIGYLYYLDTLVRREGFGIYPEYPMSALYIATGASTVTALITFDFGGNVKEQHFLWMSYLDYNGDDIVLTYTEYPQPWYQARTLRHPSVAFDSEGNIYLSRWTYDMISAGQGNNYSVEDGTISAVKFWCDRRVVGIATTDSNRFFSPQILKFSPHFDTLLGSNYVYQTRNNNIDCWETKLIYHAPHIYARFRLVPNLSQNYIVFDSLNGITTVIDYSRHAEKDVIIKYDSSLTAVNSIIIEDTITNPATFVGRMFVLLNDIVFDRDSNLAIVSSYANKAINGDTMQNVDNSHFTIKGNAVDFHRNAGIIIMDEETLELKKTAQLSTSDRSTYYIRPGISSGNLCCSNNRIFTQSQYYGEVRFPNHVFQAPSTSCGGVCLGVFDYSGNHIVGIDYSAYSSSYAGGINIKDSVLYLINLLSSGATFGDINVPSRGTYFACIAKYVDPMFMSTYERPRDTTVCVTVTQQELTVVRYPNPTTGRLTIDMQGRPLREAYVAAIDGIAELLPVTPLGGDRYAADLTGRPTGTYILILVADDQHVYNCHVILQR